MKVAAYCGLHYGADYLAYSIKSIYDVVDEIFVLYSLVPNIKGRTELICPDTKEQLMEQAFLNDTDNKIRWIESIWNSETEHRTEAHNVIKGRGYDILIHIDSDEIWDTNVLEQLIKDSYDNPVYEFRIKMRHLWRSFNWICEDVDIQGRIYNLKEWSKKPLTIRLAKSFNHNYLWHFGMARTVKDVEYKIAIHLHLCEFRDNWFENVFKVWRPGMNDVHPTRPDWWNPMQYDKRKMPVFMREHPYFNLKLIK